ncbi:MAG: phage tail sheath subtilisin-like domain-containing protein [Chromatiales bacterium]|nr:phage tail sheath subtilisin-like domain-containing protein [Gammaproteobacteria bacterium]
MTVSFNDIPSTIRVPLVYVEFDNARAVQGTPGIEHKMLVIGQKHSSGLADAGVPIRITSVSQAEEAFGRTSMLAEMFTTLKAANRYIESWAIPLADASGLQAAGKITITGNATDTGTLAVYIAGHQVLLGVTAGNSNNTMASALAVAINAIDRVPVLATVDGTNLNEVILTCNWKGETGNGIDIRFNYYQGELYPAGVTVSITAMAGGTINPDISSAITAMGDEWWNTLVMPYTDTANLNALRDELNDRWGPTRMIDGQAYTAFKGTHAATGTFGNGRNDHLVSCMGTGESPTPPYIWAVVNAGIAAASISIDPARPLQTLPLTGILPPKIEDRWTMEERNLLLYDGISTFNVNAGGQVQIERQITTYQKNSFGLADPSYLDVNTPATLSYIRYATRARITQKFPRYKLADDGTRVGPGQAIVTPSVIRDELLALFRELEEKGLVENFDQYKTDLLVERNADDPNRVDVLSSPDLVNQFRIFAEKIQFIV